MLKRLTFFLPLFFLIILTRPALNLFGELSLSEIDDLAKKNFIRGVAMLEQDPKSYAGYKLAMMGLLMQDKETAFYHLVETAKAQGVPKDQISWLAAIILYSGARPEAALHQLHEFEKLWIENAEKSGTA